MIFIKIEKIIENLKIPMTLTKSTKIIKINF
ncbi:hypothetical protein MUDAN_BIHEEGNE_03026 [Lactiplantibacillus mudanjiangensis]|uniref:Uncharacterized protein n=1 Tax=Lactiplantibacillus mudanjiangensis TaxID=1296538 RepID=A0A660E141_9LACO|nr:hypothetical protein MUDAN_BIHEEGNE_03026 [Lactiplantibacillus mudanjiangensis]VDG26077.1 hypothetical protein MUDAN_IGPPGNFN_01448 [Lactiplantibacillus mudanjiangensis]VDG29085.1 hypothetical protein MUDAN_MDHGFNIF_00767 [Lactiplantibacillus mudanjiangensis]VDG31602.1 hypothetical protein MUDAN_DOGOELCO_00892 [Lactiplantibacillus mudanjiangensis]